MLHAIALLPALTLATPIIDGATAGIVDGHLQVDVTVSEPIIREDVRAKIDGGALAIYVDGASVGKKSFSSGSLTVSALPRASYAKMQVPLSPELGCSGAISLKIIGDSTVRATMACTGEGAAAPAEAPALAKALAKAKTEIAATEKASAPVEKAPALVAAKIPAVEKAPAVVEKAPLVAEKAPAAAEKTAAPVEKAAAPVAKPAAEKAPLIAEKAPATKPADERAAAHAATRDALAGKAAAPAGPSPVTLTIFMALAGVAGFLVWRKRKQRHSGLIRILETASIGPKRAIVIAEVNGERMILGTSEAGISVLTAAPGGGAGHFTSAGISPALALAAAAAAPVPTPAVAARPEAPIASGEGESNILARLFQRHKKNQAAGDDDGPSTMAEDFRDLLEDSLEDEELRRRLATGSGGRTS